MASVWVPRDTTVRGVGESSLLHHDGAMARSLRYADAVRLLGGEENGLLKVLNTTAGWIMAGTAPFIDDVLGWFDYKADLSQLSQRAVRYFYERHTGLSDYGSIDRIEAAHTVIVIAGFFEPLKDVRLPDALTRREQVALGTGTAAMPDGFVTQIMAAGRLIPAEGQSPENFRRGLHAYYQQLAGDLNEFLGGLAAAEHLREEERDKITAALGEVADKAAGHYRDSLFELVGTFPAFAHWVEEKQHQATRADIAEVMSLLRGLYTGQPPDERRAGLSASLRKTLQQRPADVGVVPDGIRIPSLEEVYVTPRFRVMEVSAADEISDEAQWVRHEIRVDPWTFLGDHLQSDAAARHPTYVVADGGGGKSSFIRMFAAVFPPERFLVLPAVLRERTGVDDIQKHLEQTFLDLTGHDLKWPQVVASAGDARPVIILDGFDELLHATGANKTGFLELVTKFQDREDTQGRKVAVVVTSRTAVADRARIPSGTLAIRLEPFGEPEIAAWLDGWNTLNPQAPLSQDVILADPGLARQPLLLVMLAVHAAGNRPTEDGPEHVINLVATREITKYDTDWHDRELRTTLQDDLRALTTSALAMFQRATGRISEDELDRDLTAAGVKPHASLRAAVDLLVRFPFRRRGSAYEFCCSAFADVLVARAIWTELEAIAEAGPVPLGGTWVPEDTSLRRLLSVRTLNDRQPIIEFLTAMATALTPSGVDNLKERLALMFRTAHDRPMPADTVARQLPPGGEPARYAVYRANLLLIMAYVTGTVTASRLFGDPADPTREWGAQALFWESQLPAANNQSLRYGLITERAGEDVRIGPAPEGWRDNPPPPADEDLNARVDFRCDPVADSLMRTAGPLRRRVGADAANALIRVGTDPSRDAYHRCLRIAVDESLPVTHRLSLAELFLHYLGPSSHLGPGEAVTFLDQLFQSLASHLPSDLRSGMVKCTLGHLDQGDNDERTARVLRSMLEPDLENVDVITAAMVLARLAERGFAPPSIRQLSSPEEFDTLVGRIGDRRPELVERLAPLRPQAPVGAGEAG